MGDLFFIIKMIIYTFVLVLMMQIKIGGSTLEEKVIRFTHQSSTAHFFQKTAQGGATFIGHQYNRFVGKMSSDFVNKHKPSQIPGQRLTEKYKEIKESLRDQWDESSKSKVKKDSELSEEY